MSVPSDWANHAWLGPPLHRHTSIGVPSAVRCPVTSRHFSPCDTIPLSTLQVWPADPLQAEDVTGAPSVALPALSTH